ncbi:hypothetical protein [Kitasatospora cystarginea]|uniref:hypothetical protein n=1 Tax=Kitasatospora cystarginea TaxID=58350 RepID=UPI0031DCF587
MTRLFDRQLAQPDPVSLYDFLSAARDLGPVGDPRAQRARTVLADPRMAAAARAVRPADEGLLDKVEDIPVVAAEAVHERVVRTEALELYGRLRQAVVRPRCEALYVEVQKLRGQLGPVEAYGWLVICRPAGKGKGSELRAFLTVEVGGRGRLISPMATYRIDLDDEGRYVPEADSAAPGRGLSGVRGGGRTAVPRASATAGGAGRASPAPVTGSPQAALRHPHRAHDSTAPGQRPQAARPGRRQRRRQLGHAHSFDGPCQHLRHCEFNLGDRWRREGTTPDLRFAPSASLRVAMRSTATA